MVIIGLGFTDHEASAALVVDGELRTAIARERLTRLKKDGIRFGSQRLDLSPAIQYCLQQNHLALSDVDLIVWNHIDHLALEEIENLLGQEGSPGFSGISHTALPHHFAHACASFYLSPFNDAAVLVADGTGGSLEGLVRHCGGPEPVCIREGSVRIQNFLTEDPQTAQELESFYSCDGHKWSILRKIVGRYGGVGGRYGAVSSLLFDSPLDAGKTMGLAEYGDPRAPHVFLEPVDEADMRAFRAARGDEWYRLKQRLQLWRTADALLNLKPNYEDRMAPGPNTSRTHPRHKVYPYLLRGVPVTRPNQVWSTDITYIRLARGFAYLVAIIDWYSRNVLSWRISNSMDASFCVDCLDEALRHHGKPEVFNSDQGSQFTSAAFTSVLKREGVAISMDGRGRALDNIFVERLWRNVKYEDVYLKGYANMAELMVGLAQYFAFYNAERPHQSLGYQTPDQVYRDGIGGGALIVDRFGDDDKKLQEKSNTGQRRAAEAAETGTA